MSRSRSSACGERSILVGRSAPALIALIALIAAPTRTAFSAEDELIAGVSSGYGLLPLQDPAHAVTIEASGWLGLTDMLWAALTVGGGGFVAGDPSPRGVFEVMGGLVLAFDVFRTIPYLEVLAGLLAIPAAEPSFRVGLGADYLVTRTISLGLVVRFRPIFEGEGDGFLSASARIALRFEL